MNEKDKATQLAFIMGSLLLENGAEISRVQDTTERVLSAFGVGEQGVYVISNALFVNAGVDFKRDTAIRYVKSSSIHFARIAAVNQLSREVCSGKYTVEQALEAAEKIKNIPNTPSWILVMACAVGSAGFSYILGGDVFDAIAAFICGIAVQLFINYADNKKMSKIASNIIGSAVIAVLAILSEKVGIGHNIDMITAGALIRLVPGVPLTTAIGDFFNSDYLSGTIRCIDAILVGGSLAIGVGVVFKLASLLAII